MIFYKLFLRRDAPDMLAPITAREEIFAGVKNARGKVRQVSVVVAVEILLVDHKRNKSAS